MSSKTQDLARTRAIELALGIHRAHDRLVEHVETFAKARGLEGVHLSILHVLGLRGTVRMGELAQRVVIGAAGMTRRASQLEELGLVQRQRSPESQRVVLIRLTKKGKALFERSFTHLQAAHAGYFDERLTKTEQAQLARLLAKL